MFEQLWKDNRKQSGKWIILDSTETMFLMCIFLALFYLYLHCVIYYHLNFWLLEIISFVVWSLLEQTRQPILLKVKQDINTPKEVNKRLTKRWIYEHWVFSRAESIDGISVLSVHYWGALHRYLKLIDITSLFHNLDYGVKGIWFLISLCEYFQV